MAGGDGDIEVNAITTVAYRVVSGNAGQTGVAFTCVVYWISCRNDIQYRIMTDLVDLQ